jgi:formamidopyrimidine-DNA glycosylase
LVSRLKNTTLLSSHCHGKQMLFRFSNSLSLGIHLGMTGLLHSEAANYPETRHDHLILRQKKQALVFTDPRLFGRVLFHPGPDLPPWWNQLPPELLSPEFTLERLIAFLKRRAKAPLKAVLLMQEHFPGIGNWMADEILWRACLHPRTLAGSLNPKATRLLHREILWVSREAMRIISPDYSDPPKSWLFLHRWKDGGKCPQTGEPLLREQIGGRTTCWSPQRQPLRAKSQ